MDSNLIKINFFTFSSQHLEHLEHLAKSGKMHLSGNKCEVMISLFIYLNLFELVIFMVFDWHFYSGDIKSG